MDKLEHTELAIVRWRRRLRRALSELDKLEKRKVRYEKGVRRADGEKAAGADQGNPPVPDVPPPAAPPVETVKARKSKEQMKPRKPAEPCPAMALNARMKAMGFRSTKKK